ncbi:MAG: Asp23/Gls24 family envelope stress response protein [Myxococcota bacterium]
MAETKTATQRGGQTGEAFALDDPTSFPGRTTFATRVVETVAGIAAREVPGVYQLGRGAVGNAVARVAGTHETRHGVAAEVGQREIALDLELVAEYGANLHEVAGKVRQYVAGRVQMTTGLMVKEVNVAVVDVHYAPEQTVRHRVV